MIGAEPHFAGMKASAKAGAEALIAYQKAIVVTNAEMIKCDRSVALQLASPASKRCPSSSPTVLPTPPTHRPTVLLIPPRMTGST